MAKGYKTGGRVKGQPNKATRELKEIARSYAPEMLTELVRLATQSESDAARVSAIKEIFDRGYGKAPQSLEHSGPNGGPIQQEVTSIERHIVDPRDIDS